MTFAEYTKKRKEEQANGGGNTPSPSKTTKKEDKPKSFAEYTQQKKEGQKKSLSTTYEDTSSYGMTKSEYDMRRSSNPSLPEYGSYDYYKNREETLRPIMKQISEDFDRRNPTYKAYVENYEAGRMPANVDNYTREKVKRLSDKFKYQNEIIAEYKDINNQLQKFDTKGIHYNESGEIDTKSGAEESKYARERYSNILSADALTTLEMAQGFIGELPTDKQNEYKQKEAMANLGLIEGQKEYAYNYYEKNKDNVYDDDFGGRVAGNYKLGRLGINSNQAGYTSYYATSDDIEASEVYQALGERIQNRNKATFKNNGATDEIIATIAQYAPQGVDQAIVGTIGRVVGGLAGSQSAGRAAATALYMYEQTAGAKYVQLLQESDLSVEDAKALATNEALASAAIEFGLDFATSKLWSKVGSSNVASKATSRVGNALTNALTNTGISEKGVKTILNVAKNTGKLILHSMGEGSEEWWQEGVSITADKYAAEGETASPFKLLLQSLWLPQYSKDDFKRMNESFMGGAIIGIGQGGIDAISSYGMNKAATKMGELLDTREKERMAVLSTKDNNKKNNNVTGWVSQNTESPQSTTPETLEQAAREVVERKNAQNSTPLYQSLEEQSKANEPLPVEDVKTATGFGENGANLLIEIAGNEDMTFDKAKNKIEVAYLSGYNGEDITFTDELQARAKVAGIDDRVVDNNIAFENSKKATVYDGTFTENEHTKNYTKTEKKMISVVAKALKMDIAAVDEILASKTYDENGEEVRHYANAKHADGYMEIASNRDVGAVIYKMIMHEGGHRMKQLAPKEFGVLMDALYKRAENLSQRAELGVSQGMRFDEVKAEYNNAGVVMRTDKYIEEIAVKELEKIFSSAREFNKWYEEISGDKSLRNNFDRFIDWVLEVFEDVKRALEHAKMSPEERANAKKALAELERIKELLADTFKASEKAAQERVNSRTDIKKSQANTELESGDNFSLSSNKISRLSQMILGMSKIKKVAGNKEIRISTDQFSVDKAIHSKKGRSAREVNARIKAIPDFETIIKQSVYSHTDTKIVGLDKTAKKGVVAMHFFKTIYNGYDIEIVVRDKGKKQFLYEVKFIENKKNSQQGMPNNFDSPAPKGDAENDTKIPQNPKSVKTDFSLKQKAPTFYSHMGKTIDDMKQDKIGANSVVSYLKGRGVKDEEIKWSGIDAFLEGKKSVTKAELQEFVAGSQLQIEETVLSEEDVSNYKIDYTDFEREQLHSFEENLTESWGEIDTLWDDMFGEEIDWDIRYNDNATRLIRRELNKRVGDDKDSRYEQIMSSIRDVELWESQRDQIVSTAKERTKEVVAPKWDEHKLEGGDNYREMLFKMPDSTYSNSAMSTHWGNTKGVLAHARIQDFETDNGKMLFVEEIQSDWHNEGQKEGYANKLSPAEVKAVAELREKQTQKHNELKEVLDAMGDISANSDLWDEATRLRKEEQTIWAEIKRLQGQGNVPDAPFRNNYHEYVLKRLIRMAAEEGYDSIGWTTADIQSKRWSERFAEGYRIEYDQDIPKFLNKYGKKWGAKVGKTSLGDVGVTEYTISLEEGETGDGNVYRSEEEAIAALVEYVNDNWGTDYNVEDAIVSSSFDDGLTIEDEVSGDEIGYIKVSETGGSVKVWSMPITESMKESVLYEGQTMFSLKKDSEGKNLTEAQAEFFKDSKVRDENGSLLVVYHGTPNKNVNKFSYDYVGTVGGSLYGYGFYFTDEENVASLYAQGIGEVKAYYITITSPVYSMSTDLIGRLDELFERLPMYARDALKEEFGDLEGAKKYYEEYIGKHKNGIFMSTFASEANLHPEIFNRILGDMGYDGIVHKENGYANEYVVFKSEQAKLTTNKNPTSNPDINFSLKKSVEETKNLIAVHNMQSSELERTLDLGGLPMPSIAIIKAQSGHSEYGDVSLVFDKSVIDPKASKLNKVYGGDAWTPVYPTIEYKPNEKIADKISDKYYELSRKFGYDESRPLYNYVYDLERKLNSNKGEAGMISELYEDTQMMQLYLLDSGKGKVETIKKETRTELTDADVEMREHFINSLGADVVDEIKWDGNGTPMEYRKNYLSKYENAIRDAYKNFLLKKFQFTDEEVQNVLDKLKPYDYIKFVRDAYNYRKDGRITTKTEDDYSATQQAIREAAGEDYRKWVDSLFKGIEEKSGIRNNVNYYTNSGNRRSWEALHWENNLENVIKVMKSQDNGVAAFFSGQAIWAVSAKDYRSIEEIKADSDRLKKMPEEEYNKIKEGLGQRLSEIAHSIMSKTERNPFIASDNAMECIVEAVRNSRTKSGILNNLKQYPQLTVTETTVDDIVALVNDISNMPTEYFEAKPKRAVELNEIATAIVPDSISNETKKRLDDMGIKYREYESGNETARLEVLNSLEDVQFSLKGTKNTSQKDTKELLDIIAHLKSEFELTKFAKADPKKLEKMTHDILKEYASKADFDEVYKAVDELYQYMANGEDGQPAVWEDVYSRANDVAQKIVENALVVDDYSYQEYKPLRDYLRTTAMKFTEYDSVPSSYDNFNDFRKKNMGRLKFAKDGMSIDAVYQELASMYPEFFDEEEYTNTSDQLEHIVEVLDSLRPMEVNPFDNDIKRVTMHLANDLTSRFFDVPQAKPTFADKAERRVVEERIKAGKKVEAVREQKDAKIKKLIESQKQKTKKQLDKLREQRDTRVRKEQEKRRDAISKMSEKQKAKVLRARIMRHTAELNQKLLKPTDKQHIPHDLQGAVLALLESINLESGYEWAYGKDGMYHRVKTGTVLGAEPTKKTKAFIALQKLYEKMHTEGNVTIDPDLVGADGWFSDVIEFSDKPIAEMTSSELDTIWQTIRAVEATISNVNKMFTKARFETVSRFAEALREDNKGKKERTELKGVFGKGKRLATLHMLTPETYFHFLGEAGDSIFRMMRDAQDKHISIMKEVSDFTRKTLKGVDVNSLEKTLHTVKLGGEDVKLTTAQLMELYVLMKREQAVEHILIGGILPDVTEGKGAKLNVRAEPIRNLSLAEISAATSKLTDEQKKIADELQKFVSTVLSKYGNEASMQVYNYEKFLEKNYWTIRTNKQEVASEIGKDTAVTSVANKGMAKGTIPHANTSVRIGSIFDTFAAHSSDMATYAAWLGTSEDVNRIRNFVFWDEGARKGTVKGILDTVHGLKGSEYLQKLLTDIAIGVKGTDNMNPFDKFIGSYKAASVGANLRVIIQQPTAIIRALDMIDAQHLAKGAIRPLKGWEKAKKYAPIAQWKDWGHFDINTGRQMKDVLFDNASLLEKTKQAGMWGASMMDSLAWGQLWNAIESETRANHKGLEVGSDAYYETVAKRFTEIVDHTQVVDGILQRSQIMRSPDSLTKMATSFMGEPTKQYNMAVAAAYDARTLKGDARKKAVAQLGRTALALATAGIVNACVQSIIDAMRDDDKEKDYWEKWLASFVGDGEDTKFISSNLVNVINPLGYVPFVKDIFSIMQGYDVKRMDAEAISKAFGAVTNMYKAITGTGKYTKAEASAQLFAETARLYGLPVANVKRDIKSLVMSIAIESDSYLMQYRMEKAMLDINYAGNNKNFMDILFNAYNNDRKAYEYIYNDMLKNGYDADKIKDGMETRMKKAEGVKKSTDLTKRWMTPTKEKTYNSSLNKVKSSNVWKSASATQRKEAEADLYEFLTATGDDIEEIRAEARAYGIDETEYTLWQLAKEMANTDGKDGLSNKEKAAAIKKLDLDSDAEWNLYFFRNKENKGATYAYEKGIDSDTYADFIEALNKYDKPTKSGKLGTFTQDEATKAIKSLDGLSRKEKAALWQSVNTNWKNNPF